MRSIEIRRHSYTKKGEGRGRGSHLSMDGVILARTVGQQMEPFDLVLTSLNPRTLETALAMGFAVTDQLEALGDITPEVVDEIGHHERWGWGQPFVRFAEFVGRNGPTAFMGQRQQAVWRQALETIPVNGKVLIISHGRVIEAGLVTCLSGTDFSNWGKPFGHCEGVTLDYTEGRFINVQFKRLPALA